jgi:hypothetical protein
MAYDSYPDWDGIVHLRVRPYWSGALLRFLTKVSKTNKGENAKIY